MECAVFIALHQYRILIYPYCRVRCFSHLILLSFDNYYVVLCVVEYFKFETKPVIIYGGVTHIVP